MAIKRRVLPPEHPYLGFALKHMAQLYDQVGRTAEARTLRQELAEFQVKLAPDQQSAAEQSILDQLKAKAAEGDAQAQFDLGSRYFNGRGVAQDCEAAVKWTRKAADQGHAAAQCALGAFYVQGISVDKDAAEAVKLFRKAADRGYALAQLNLGNCYFKGDGVTKDPAEAAGWYRKAAEQGNTNAQNNLAACYERGDGVAKDEVEAYKWYLLAAAHTKAKVKDNAARLELLLTPDQITDGKRRADNFKPQARTQP